MIVGAGAVGCYLGRILGEQEIWELRESAFEKTCGGLFSKNIKDLKVDLSESLENEVKGARFFSPNDSFEVKTNETQAFVVDRFKLQKTLIQDAENEKCRIEWSRPWRGQEDNLIMGCDGAYSEVMQSCGIKRNYFNCYQVECTLMNKIDPDFVELHFGSFAPGFFGWLIPVDEKKVRIGLGCTEGNPKQHFESFKNKFHIAKIIKEQAALIPIYDGQKTVFKNKVLVGDAAGQVKATSGGGVVFGLKCAEELKKAIDRKDLNRYDLSWRTKYGNDLKTHLMIRKFLNKVDYDKLFQLIKEKELDKLIEEHGDMEDTSGIKKQLMKRPDLWLSFGKLFF